MVLPLAGTARGRSDGYAWEEVFARLLLLVVGSCLSAAAHGGAIVVSDGTFDPADWSVTVVSSVGGATETVGSSESGGNPGDYRTMSHQLPPFSSIAVVHIYEAFSYDPGALGTLSSIDYSEDQIQTVVPFPGAAVGATFAIRQDGEFFVTGDGTFTTTTWAGWTPTQWNESSFANPDFSETGAPIFFGYLRSNSNESGGGITNEHGIDNWSVELMPVPEPAHALLLMAGALVLAGAHRARG